MKVPFHIKINEGTTINIIFFETFTQFENSGDELINLALINLIRPHGQVILNDRNSPDWYLHRLKAENDILYSKKYGASGFYFGILKHQIANRLKKSDTNTFLLLPPGHFSRKGKRVAAKTLELYLKLQLLNWFGVKIVRLGFSIGPFDNANVLAEKFGSKAFKFYGVRDTVTLDYAKKIGIDNCDYFPDMAWALNVAEYPRKKVNENKIVVCFRSNSYGTVHDQSYLTPLILCLEALLLESEFKDCELVFCHQVEFDKEPSRLLHEHFAGKHVTTLLDNRLGIADAHELYSEAAMVISNRLHVLILAALAGTLPLALIKPSHNGKITSIFNDNGLAECIVDSEKSTLEVCTKIAEAFVKRVRLLEHFENMSNKNILKMKATAKNIFSD
ncbi:polysaccharide pyruvyl transferase family protein [Glaciecola sp. SC05]|uniref:polysaccharide pyruvyl transferase family protein n=1 Tax=Glaciecola sp. SC05 TaxID=1987355 RepID=UPI0035272FBB